MLKNVIQRLAVAILIIGMVVPPTGSARELAGEVEALPPSSGLYRTRVAVRQPADWARLEKLGVVVLEGARHGFPTDYTDSTGGGFRASVPESVSVLADEEQLEALARLRFEPQATDELGLLVSAQDQGKGWLRASLRPLLERGAALQALKAQASVAEQATVAAVDAAQAELRAAMHALTAEQQAGIAALTSVDDDADGLTNTQEAWWCTDPMNPDSDGDGVNDGDEVQALLDGDTTDGPPYQGWPMVPGDSAYDPQCIDRDQDVVPDMAERWIIGLNANWETTDGDRFDDGQELFGITKSGYGEYPRSVDSDFISSNMPGWVDPPGASPFVAAYPQISIDVIPDSLQIILVATVTAGQAYSAGESFAYGTAETKGVSVGVGKTETHTWQEWMEVGNSAADTYERSHYEGQMTSAFQQFARAYSIGSSTDVEYGGERTVTVTDRDSIGSKVGARVGTEVSGGLECHLAVGCADLKASIGAKISADYSTELSTERSREIEQKQGNSWNVKQHLSRNDSGSFVSGSEIGIETGDTVNYGRVYERSVTHNVGREYSVATTVTREEYEEQTVSNEHQIASEQEWSTATAQDTSHAAELRFSYRVQNTGTDYARRIEDILFNIYIGDDPVAISAYASAWTGSSCTKVVITNRYPGDYFPETGNATQCNVPLTLDQLRAIDSGATIRVVVADYRYDDDQSFYENAWGQGVIFEIDDGVADGDLTLDAYLIPTWGEETYQDMLKRYFDVQEEADGRLRAIRSPDYDPNHEISAWNWHNVISFTWLSLIHI